MLTLCLLFTLDQVFLNELISSCISFFRVPDFPEFAEFPDPIHEPESGEVLFFECGTGRFSGTLIDRLRQRHNPPALDCYIPIKMLLMAA